MNPCNKFLPYCLLILTALGGIPAHAQQSISRAWIEQDSPYDKAMLAGRFDEAEIHANEALIRADQLLTGKSEQTILNLNNAGEVNRLQGRSAVARSLHKRALDISIRDFGEEHTLTATSLAGLSNADSQLGEHRQAEEYMGRALSIRLKALDNNHPDIAAAQTSMALIQFSLAHYDKAVHLHLGAIKAFKESVGLEHPLTALAELNLAWSYSALGLHKQALQLREHALEIGRKTLEPGHPGVAWALDDVASSYSALDQYDKAIAARKRSLEIRLSVFGPSSAYTAASLGNLADTYAARGDYAEALTLQQRALGIREKVYGEVHFLTANTLSSLSGVFLVLGQYEQALEFEQRARLIREKVFGAKHPTLADSLDRIGGIYLNMQMPDKAQQLFEQALLIKEKSLGSQHPNLAPTLEGIAGAYISTRRVDMAFPILQRALLLSEIAFGEDSSQAAARRSVLSLVHISAGQFEQAVVLLGRALAVFVRVHGTDHPDTAFVQHLLGYAYQQLGLLDQAIFLQKMSVNTQQAIRARVSEVGISYLATYTNKIDFMYQQLADLLILQGRLSEAQRVLDMLKEAEQFDFIRRSESEDIRKTRTLLTGFEQKWASRFGSISNRLIVLGAEDKELQKLSPLGLTQQQKSRQQEVAKDLRRMEEDFSMVLDELRSSLHTEGRAKSLELEEINKTAQSGHRDLLASLGDDVALLQYYVTKDKVGILLSTSAIKIARSIAIDSTVLNRQVAAFRRQLKDPKSDLLPLAKSLYKTLLEPVEGDLMRTGVKTIMLSLDGALRYLPFSALHDGKQYALERWQLPIYTNITRSKLTDSIKLIWSAAAMGVTKKHAEFDPLPAVHHEINSIVKRIAAPKHASLPEGILPGARYVDEEFNEKSLKDVSNKPFEVLHIASHFRFSPGTEVNSFLLLGDGQRLTLGDIRTQNYRFNNVELLTLSACETGLGGGRNAQGSEIEGFGVIAQQQGAKAVLATLWQVADRSTSSLMTDMYRNHQSHRLSKIEALRISQLNLRDQPKYSHPFYWAPFILMGNWK